jgi:hypothetical protein
LLLQQVSGKATVVSPSSTSISTTTPTTTATTTPSTTPTTTATTTPTTTTNRSGSTNTHGASAYLSLDRRHIHAIGTTADTIARTLLGVGSAIPEEDVHNGERRGVSSPPILPTTPHRKERVVVSVAPIANHGLCTQFDACLRVSAFRCIPGSSLPGPVEREGVQRKDRLIRVNGSLVEGRPLNTVIDHLKQEMRLVVENGLRVELEFVRVVLL